MRPIKAFWLLGLSAFLTLQSKADILSPPERRWLTENQPRLVVGVEAGYAPFVFINEKNQAAGMAQDYLELLEAKIGIRFRTIRVQSLDEAFEKVRSGDVQIVNAVTQTPWRSTFIRFSAPFVSVPNVIMVQKGRSPPDGEHGLAGLKVSLVKNYAVTEYLINRGIGLVPDPVPDDLTALYRVSFGNSDAAVIDLASASYLITQKGITNLSMSCEIPYPIQLSIGIAKTEPMLASIVQKGLASITGAEKLTIRRRWINLQGPGLFADWRFWAIIGVVLSVSLMVFMGFVIWNRTLKRQVDRRTADLARGQEALRKSEEKHRRLFETMVQGVVYQDGQGQIISANPAAERILGLTQEQMLGKTSMDPGWRTIREDGSDLPGSEHPSMVALRTGKAVYAAIIGVYNPLKNEHRWISTTAIPLFKPGETRPFQVYATFDDISAVRLAELEKKELENQLQQARKMESIGRLAGGVAHDFNNMLAVIAGHVELAMIKAKPDQDLHEDLQEIQKAAERSTDLTRQLLAYARKQTVAPQVLDLNETVEKMLKMLGRLIGEDVELVWRPGDRIGPVSLDPSQLDQIMTNLCLNARDAITTVRRIIIETENVSLSPTDCLVHPDAAPGDYALLSVQDTGSGMDAETRAHLFEPFFTTKGLGRGTGLGLATVYGIVSQNKGFIDVRSAPGEGTQFLIHLPQHHSLPDSSTLPSAAQKPAKGTETILFVEDEAGLMTLAQHMLQRFGYRVLAANTPAGALDQIRQHSEPIDLLITDVVMPGMNGHELAQALQTLHPNLKVLYTSGYTADIIAHHGVLEQGVQFLPKPFTMSGLARKVREVLDLAASEK
jgi:two-component system sensor histidine kinase EvgS